MQQIENFNAVQESPSFVSEKNTILSRMTGALQYAAPAIISITLLVAVEPGLFLGTRLIGFDAQVSIYAWYVNALLAFHHGPFTILDPFNLGGMSGFNLLAYFDPLYFAPLLTGAIPNLYQEQLIVLAHIILIPISVLSLGRLYRITGWRIVVLVALATIAAYVGPAFKYMENSDAVDSYAWGFVGLAALEYFRAKGALRFAILASLSFAYAMIRFPEGAAMWPVFVVPYLMLYWKELRSHKNFLRYALIACTVMIAILAPNIIAQAKLWHSIAITTSLQPVQEAQRWDWLGYFGGYRFTWPSMASFFIYPGILSLLFLNGLFQLRKHERIVIGAVVAVLLLYALGNTTPFGDFFRHLYFPAALFRRPYAALYVAIPIVFWIIVRDGFSSPSTRSRIALTTIFLAIAGICIANNPSAWAIAIFGCGTSVIAAWAIRKPVIIALLLSLQWTALVLLPLVPTEFYAHPRVERLELFNQFSSIEKYLSPISSNSNSLFRVVAAGLPAEFGPYASVFEYYNLMPSVGTRFPRELFHKTTIETPQAEHIADDLRANPQIIASPALRDMAVRYYFFNPASEDIAAAARKIHPDLTLRNGGYWTVLEDPRAKAFVHSASGSPISATINWDTVSFIVPQNTRFVDVAYLYDPWWSAKTQDGTRTKTMSNAGQLRIDVSNLAGASLILHYGSFWFDGALLFEITCYLALIFWAGRRCVRSLGSLRSSYLLGAQTDEK